MRTSLFHIDNHNKITEMKPAPYENEDAIQSLLESHPEVLAGDQFAGEEPRRWALVAREVEVPDGEGGSARWSLDHLYLDQDAIPTLVEVKRRSDTRSRREVIGQMFDYAANGPSYWAIGDLQASFATTHTDVGSDSTETLQKLFGDGVDAENYWPRVEDNLRNGRIRMIFVVDDMPPELLRIVEFLARQMRDAEVYAVEIRQHLSPAGRLLSTRVLGRTQNAETKISKTQSAVVLNEAEWLDRLEVKHGAASRATAIDLIEHARQFGLETFVTQAQNPSIGTRVKVKGSTRYPFFLVPNGKASISLSYLVYAPGFASDEKRQELVDRMHSAGFEFQMANLNGDIRIPLSALAAPEIRARYLQVLRWMVGELPKEASVGG
ncbi:hypothetical protein AB0V79_17125 [Mesorhizobium ciceri]|uniref:hypothetical protein n=1 Tax=Mesorhizobium ciceri TaxID=39645 RepID=UPI0007A93A61|nr:hypothetical protein [Mesorhizobium ciceri]AMX99978.1 hypothetical protein A4R29_11100 [Mesorhizobium ciceri biovar biserrulae]